MNFSTNSCERASAGFDWLGTLSIHDTKLKLKDSSLRHTCLFMRSMRSFADLHLIRHAWTAWLPVKTITLFPAIRSLKRETPRASPSSSKMMVSWSDRLMAETNSGGAASLKKPRHLPSLSGSKPPMPEWPPGSKAASSYKCAQPKCLASTSRGSFASIRLFKVQKAAWSSGKSFWSPCWYACWAAHRGNSETASQTSGSRQTAPDPWAFLPPTCSRTGCLKVWLQRQAGPVTIPVRWLLWCNSHRKDAGKRKGW